MRRYPIVSTGLLGGIALLAAPIPGYAQRAGRQPASSPPQICVFSYIDLNANGTRDAGEPPHAGVTFSVGTPGGLSRVTDSSGRACFPLLPIFSMGGSTLNSVAYYDFYEAVPTGWFNTEPGGSPPHRSVAVPIGQTPSVAVFGNRRG